MMDSGLNEEPYSDLAGRSELSKIDPLQNLLELEQPLKYSSEVYLKQEPLKSSQNSSASHMQQLKAYEKCIEVTEAYLKVS